MAKRPAMTKSPMVLAKLALKTAQDTMPPYSDIRSRHDFTQAQIFTILVLRQFFKTDYRGIIRILQEHQNIKDILNMNNLPHFTTLQKAQQRMLKKTFFRGYLRQFSIMQETVA